MPGPVPGGGEWVDLVDHPATCSECGDPQAVVGFDPDRDQVFGGVAGFGECLEQSGEPGGVVVDSSPAHDFAQVVEDCEVVMVFGPIDSAVQSHRASQCRCAGCEQIGRAHV